MKPIVTFIFSLFISFVLLTQVSQAQNTQTNPDPNGNPPQTQSLGWVRVPIDTNLFVVLGFISKDTCCAVNSASYYRSLDGGSTWHRISWPIPISGGIRFFDPQSGYVAVGSNDTVYHTLDGGQNWSMSSDSNQLVTIVVPVTRDTAFIIGDYISRTTNGGKSWTLTPKRPNFNRFQSAAFFDSKHGICVGNTQPGPLPAHHELTAGCFTTANGGETWEQQYTGAPQDFQGVAYVSVAVCIAIEGTGDIFRTVDGGQNWSVINSGFNSHHLYGVATHGNVVFAVGAAGTILNSLDAGISWKTQVSGVSTDLFSIETLSESLALAAGDAGVILKTTNGGTDWVQVAPPSSQSLSVLSFQDPETPNVEIVYALPQLQNVTAIVYSLQGKQVATLANGELQQPGKQRLIFNSSAVPSGTYIVTITTNRYHASGKFEITH